MRKSQDFQYLLRNCITTRKLISPAHGRYHPRQQLQSSANTDNPEKALGWSGLGYSAKTASCRRHPTSLKHLDIFHTKSQKVPKSPSHWKAVGEIKNTQMSLSFATTKEFVSWKYPELNMVGQYFSTFSNICGMEEEKELFALLLPFYSNHVALVSFYTVLIGKQRDQVASPFPTMGQ